MNIHLHIERLVLEGLPLPGSERASLQATVESELARLFEGEEFRINPLAEPCAVAPEIQYQFDSTGQQLGRHIGRSVFASLNPFRRASKATRAGNRQSESLEHLVSMQSGILRSLGASVHRHPLAESTTVRMEK